MDISDGTYPKGSTWRRNPIPACNCDAGKDCGVNKFTGPKRYPAYFNAYANEGQPEPETNEKCPTGTQFPVPFDGGYGQHMFTNTTEYMWAVVDRVQLPQVTGDFVF